MVAPSPPSGPPGSMPRSRRNCNASDALLAVTRAGKSCASMPHWPNAIHRASPSPRLAVPVDFIVLLFADGVDDPPVLGSLDDAEHHASAKRHRGRFGALGSGGAPGKALGRKRCHRSST